MEKWAPINGTHGLLEISNQGRVRSLMRDGRILKTQTDNKGYTRVRVTIRRERMTFKVHREVAKAFIENPHNFPQVNHIDGNKQNNSADNLEWITNRENAIHASEVLGTLGLDEVEIKRRTICVLEGCDDRYQFTKYKKFVDKTLLMESDVPISILDCVFPSNIFGMRQYWNYLLELFSDRESGSTLLELSNKYGKDIAFLSRVRSKKLYKKQWSIYETFKKS